MDAKNLIINNLDIMRRGDEIRGEKFSALAYVKAIKALNAISGPITSVEDVKGIKGIGAKITAKIAEILETGSLAAAERTKSELNLDIYSALLKIHGVGPVKAKELVKTHGITSIADLRAKQELLNDVQKLGLKYYEDINERIPREEMLLHEILLKKLLPAKCSGDIVGSFRRNAVTSGDIDMLLRLDQPKKQFKEYIAALQTAGYLKDCLAVGVKKCMAVVALPNGKARRLDLLVTPPEEYACSLLYFTGSDTFNVAFRAHCTTKGYTLNEHALTPLNESVEKPPSFQTEEQLFQFVGLQFVAPELRSSATVSILPPS
jgi:DNA polymerase beta